MKNLMIVLLHYLYLLFLHIYSKNANNNTYESYGVRESFQCLFREI